VVIDNTDVMVIDRFAVAVFADESFTCTVKFEVPAAVGVPVMAPVALLIVRFEGSDPLLIVNAYPPLPPLAPTLPVYGAFTTPLGRLVVVIDNADVMVIDRFAVAVFAEESFTCTVKFEMPAAVGVPVMAPVALLIVRFEGSDPLLIENAYPPLPPLAPKLPV
jgi:hypothetical protein